MIAEQQRAERYSDFDMMIYEPIIATALTIYADEMTTHSPLQDILEIKCKNEEIKSILYNLYYIQFDYVLKIYHNFYNLPYIK